mmetsp:Transcript_69407/g.201113  ORF Transcript_69407/g.201113 Transcript_69407/m.201113 type:complete len:261 (-) Transcript_69407:919-1701(-)
MCVGSVDPKRSIMTPCARIVLVVSVRVSRLDDVLASISASPASRIASAITVSTFSESSASSAFRGTRIGMKVSCKQIMIRQAKPCLSSSEYNMLPSSTSSPNGRPRHRKARPVVLPKTRRYSTTMTNVALTNCCLAASLTHVSLSSLTRTRDTPPRKPEWHIMAKCFQEIMRVFSFGKCRPTRFFTQFDTTPSGMMVNTRATRQMPERSTPSLKPEPRLMQTKTPMTPQKRKISESAKEDICFSRKLVNAMLSCDRYNEA